MAFPGLSVLFVLVCLGNVLLISANNKDANTQKMQASGWKPIVVDPKTGKNVTLKLNEKDMLNKMPPKGIEVKKVDIKTDRSGRILIEPGHANAFYVWLPTDILNIGSSSQQQQGPSFRNSGSHGPFGPQSPAPSSFAQQQQSEPTGRHRPNYLPDQGADVQPGGVRIYSGFHPVNPPPPSPHQQQQQSPQQNYQRPQPAYQPPPGAAPNPVNAQYSQQGPQMYIPQGEIPRPNPQSYHGPRAENGPPQYHGPPQHFRPQQQYQTSKPQQYSPPPPPPVPQKSPSGGYGGTDIDDDEELPEPGYGSAPKQNVPESRPEPGYGSPRRRPQQDYGQAPQVQSPQHYMPAPPPQPQPQVERGYGAPIRRPSSYGQPVQQYQQPPLQPQVKAYDPPSRPIGIVSARPQPQPGYGQPPKRPEQPPMYSKPIPMEAPKSVGGGSYGRPEPFDEDEIPQQRPQTRPVTVPPSNEFFPGTVTPGRVPTPDEEAGVGIIEPRGLPSTCPAVPKTNVRGQNLRDIAREVMADYVFSEFGVSESDIFSAAGNEGQFTVFLPANEARHFTNPDLLTSWKQDRNAFIQTLANHIVAGQISLDKLRRGGSYVTKNNQNAIINARGHDDGIVTVNGQRVIYSDIPIPNGGLLHIVSGFLHPVADKDVIGLIQDCGKYDGYVTLASGTGFNQELVGNPNGYTLFLPSNDALSKVPKEELEIIRTNTTALREFLRYHAAEGIHYSHDLRDGQYLSSLHNKAPIRVSVNTDGCRRRLYEVNNSPLYRADIPASNGVVHVVDWVLLPSDHKWCSNVILP